MVFAVEREPIERFEEKYRRDASGCWLWVSSTNGRYPKFWDLGRGGQVLAHRWSYEHFVGPIPQGMEIDHLCNTPRCVNPAHLEAVTHDENMRRLAARRTHCPSGHPYSGDNLRVYKGTRLCKTCDREAHRSPDFVPFFERTHCGNGHLRTELNTGTDRKRGVRYCKDCQRDARRRRSEAVEAIIAEHGYEALKETSSQVLDTNARQQDSSRYGPNSKPDF